MINPMIIAAGISVISAGTSTGVCIWKQKQLETEMDRFTIEARAQRSELSDSIEKLSKTITVDVEDAYIHSIVETAVNRETSAQIKVAANSAVQSIKTDMSKKIQKEINKSYEDLRASVKAEMERQVGQIDLDDIRKEIIAEGKEAATKKFKKDLDKIIEQYNDNLTQITTIYGSIADTLKNANNKSTTLTIG